MCGQQTREQMLDITNYQRTKIKTTVMYQTGHLMMLGMVIINKSMIDKYWEGVEKKEPSYIVGGNVN